MQAQLSNHIGSVIFLFLAGNSSLLWASSESTAIHTTERADSVSLRADQAAEKAEHAAEKAESASEQAFKASEAAKKATEAASETVRESKAALSSGAGSHRVHDTIGGFLSAWGDPFPTTLGVNLAYNVSDWARVNLGVGSDDEEHFKVSTFGMGAKFMVPGWNLTPIVGINLAFTKDAGSNARRIRGFSPDGSHVYGNIGFDWQSGIGLNFGAGYAMLIGTEGRGSCYLNLGLFL